MQSTDVFFADSFESRMCDDLLFFLLLKWLDATDLVALDVANQSNRWMRTSWLRVLRGALDLRPLRGLLYTHFWIRWLIDRGVRSSSMQIVQGSEGGLTNATFESMYLPELASIITGGGCDIRDASVGLIVTGCVNLRSIDLTKCSRLTSEALVAIGQHCKGLTLLNISECHGVEDDGMSALARGCTQLKSIKIGLCTKLTDTSLAAIGETCRGLTSIDTGCNENITDIGISSLTRGCSLLEKINIASCYELTDISLASIGETCRGLTSINMSGNKDMIDVTVASLTKGCRLLHSINID